MTSAMALIVSHHITIKVEREIEKLKEDLENSARMSEDAAEKIIAYNIQIKELATQMTNLQGTQFELKVI